MNFRNVGITAVGVTIVVVPLLVAQSDEAQKNIASVVTWIWHVAVWTSDHWSQIGLFGGALLAKFSARARAWLHDLVAMPNSVRHLDESVGVQAVELAQLIEHQGLAMFRMSPLGEITYVSDAFCELLCVDREDVVRFGYLNYCVDRTSLRGILRDAIAECSRLDHNFEVHTCGGKQIRVHCEARPAVVRDAVVAYIGTWKEIPTRS